MILKYLYIDNYKKLKNFELQLFDKKENSFLKKIYKDLNISVFVGENGTGKTSILSFIAIVFKNLQRFHEKIPCDFKMIYELENYKGRDIILEKNGIDIQFTINNRTSILLKYDIKKHKYENNDKSKSSITYDDIIDYLPSNIIVSCFDTGYPKDYNWNYHGHKILEIKDISVNYSDSSFGMNLSRGIILFSSKYFLKDNKDLRNLFASMGFKFNNYVFFYTRDHLSTLPYEVKEDIMEDFYLKFKFKNWKNFLKDAKYNTKEEFINHLFSKSYWSSYISNKDTDDLSIGSDFVDNQKLNIKKFISDNFYNLEFINLLIEKQYLFINEFFVTKNSELLSLKMLSTGEKILFCRLLFVLSKIQDDSLIILEEPEMHLNYSWVKQLISVIKDLFQDYRVHFLISTHNQAFINTLFPENIIVLDKWKAKHPNFNTFLANDKEINKNLFPKSLVNNSMENEIINIIEEGSKFDLYNLMNILGESYLKFLVFKKLQDEEGNHVEGHK